MVNTCVYLRLLLLKNRNNNDFSNRINNSFHAALQLNSQLISVYQRARRFSKFNYIYTFHYIFTYVISHKSRSSWLLYIWKKSRGIFCGTNDEYRCILIYTVIALYLYRIAVYNATLALKIIRRSVSLTVTTAAGAIIFSFHARRSLRTHSYIYFRRLCKLDANFLRDCKRARAAHFCSLHPTRVYGRGADCTRGCCAHLVNGFATRLGKKSRVCVYRASEREYPMRPFVKKVAHARRFR